MLTCNQRLIENEKVINPQKIVGLLDSLSFLRAGQLKLCSDHVRDREKMEAIELVGKEDKPH